MEVIGHRRFHAAPAVLRLRLENEGHGVSDAGVYFLVRRRIVRSVAISKNAQLLIYTLTSNRRPCQHEYQVLTTPYRVP